MKSVREFLQKPNMIMDSKALEDFRRQREEEDRALVQQILKDNAAAKRAKLQRIFDENSLIPKKLLPATFDNYRPGNKSQVWAKQKCWEYADFFDPEESSNLLMTGPYGVGKSHLAKSIQNRLIENGYTCIYISTPKLLTKIRSTYNRESEYSELELLEVIEQVDCLVLDDIGAENGTDWTESKVFEVVESRLGKHTIYTTNLSGKQLEKQIGERNMSRLMQDTETLQVIGEDYRRRGLRRAGE
ncbi:ATP-binding protein [Aneurinibacillus migulanus]|uniref:ATP-binding protein n=1 Tax=Aneurinibacillus migulanus TaxID=47500 RepID=UPI00069A9B1E|nr:ATP-binding protein [Aneurinibacillus migulanus]MED0890948.1 ATP-binding protein [Aneurinibacillus migulanus]MED1616640.1 ATP-binding protein [Aneurinibacillus migulanus]GED13785.1 DNA replication protein DnaC [Aneurinibacillus migulanus]